jgi:hypothetical protein
MKGWVGFGSPLSFFFFFFFFSLPHAPTIRHEYEVQTNQTHHNNQNDMYHVLGAGG